MDKLTQDLLLYELLLMVFGSALFLALLIILVVKSLRNQPLKTLVLLFIIPIIMIGFPAFQSIKVADMFELVLQKSKEVTADPGNLTKAQELQNLLDQVNNDRIKNNPEKLSVVAGAYSALGKYDTAEAIVDEAIKIDSTNEGAKAVKEDVGSKKKDQKDFEERMKRLHVKVVEIENDPNPTPAKIHSVVTELAAVKPPAYVDDKSLLTVAHALNVVGEKETAMRMIDQVIESKPESTEAVELKTKIEADTATPPQLQPAVMQNLRESQVVANPNALLLNRRILVKKPN